MKYFSILIFSLFLSLSIFAEENSQNKFGIGFSMEYDYFSTIPFSQELYYTNSPYHILLTSINNGLKYELQTSIFKGSRSSGDYSQSFLIGDFSFGLYLVNSLRNDFNLYYGGKLGLVFSSQSSDGINDNESDTDLVNTYITPIIGGEFFLAPNFSISGEIGLKINVLDNDGEESDSEYYITTTSSILIKWYF